MLDAVASPPPKPAANPAPAPAARDPEKDGAGFQGRLREALDQPNLGDRAPTTGAAPQSAEPAAENGPEAKSAKISEGPAGADAAIIPQATEPSETAEPGDSASESTAPPVLALINDAMTTAQADQTLAQMAPTPPVTALAAPGVLPLVPGIVAGQPVADQPDQPLQDTPMGEAAPLLSAAPPMVGAAMAAPTTSHKLADKDTAALPEGAASAPQALAAKDMPTKDQTQAATALEETLAQALAVAPAQAASDRASIKPQTASNTPKPGPITPAEAALAATKPTEAASRLAQAFNATEAASHMKLVMAAETTEAGMRLASLEAPKNATATPSGEARAEAIPIATLGFAPTDGIAPRAEAALHSTNTRELPAPVPARQLAPVVVSLALGRGDEALTIALDPEELGRVEVSIGQGKEVGQVRIIAERPETLALLQRDQRELDRALNQSGLGDMARSLSFSLASDQGHRQSHGSPHGRGQRASMTISGIEADRAMSTLPAPLRNPNALIDIAV